MSRQAVRFVAILALVGSCVLPGAAQEDEPVRKKAPSKAIAEARSREAQKRAKARAKEAAETRAKAVDINRAGKEDLMKLPGMTAAYAEAVITKRPYRTKADLVTKGAIPEGVFLSLRKLVAVK